ncbi:MAG: DUF3073 domain-containing protein [Candidatus Ancillula sp.]|jgi:hypothetical protein|nr:DUF3073 domain-containing protein [Candidatus Ancillula sp.]
MGRGRQKALAKKIAREAKYSSFDTDFDALADELNSQKAVSVRDKLKTGYEPEIGVKKESEEDLEEMFAWAAAAAKKAESSDSDSKIKKVLDN